jgi:hypothetical protein
MTEPREAGPNKHNKAGSEVRRIFSSLSIAQLWGLAAATVAYTVGVFGFGVFVQKTVDSSADLVKDQQIAKLTTQNGDLQRGLDTLTERLKTAFGEKRWLDTKAELLTRLVFYLQSHDDTSKKLLTDVVCTMWKESEGNKIRVIPGPIQLNFADLQKGLPPDVEKLLLSRGVSESQLRQIRDPGVAGSTSVGPFPDFQKTIRVQREQVQRAVTINDVTRQVGRVEVIKIVTFPDGSQFQMPQEIAAAVHLKPDCAPQSR